MTERATHPGYREVVSPRPPKAPGTRRDKKGQRLSGPHGAAAKAPQRPPVEVVVFGRDLLFVRSSYPIQKTYLANPHEQYSYFVDYSADCRQAVVTLRTARDPLQLVVETGILGMGLHRKHCFTIRNPSLRR